MRQLSPIEQDVSKAVVELGSKKGWEFAAFLESPFGPCIEIRTIMRPDGADPSLNVLQKAGASQLVCHHNHISHESLSSADWRGLARIFNETWAHCEDGTRYYGRVLDIAGVERVLRTNYEDLEQSCEAELFKLLDQLNYPEAVSLAVFFRKEVLNRALLLRGMVEYEFDWGTNQLCPPAPQGVQQLTHHVGHYGVNLAAEIDRVAKAIAAGL